MSVVLAHHLDILQYVHSQILSNAVFLINVLNHTVQQSACTFMLQFTSIDTRNFQSRIITTLLKAFSGHMIIRSVVTSCYSGVEQTCKG